MPVYNSSKYLRESIDSVINQTYKNIELICVDDGSTDISYAILKEYAKKHSNIKVFKNKKNLGISKTSNYAISKAVGTFIARLDSDDIMTVTRVEKQVTYLLNNPDVIVVGGQVQIMSENGYIFGFKSFPINFKDIYAGMFTLMTVQQGAMMVNTTKLPHGFVWYKDDRKTAEEVDLFFRMFNYGTFANLTDVVLYYRQYNSSTSLKDPKDTFFNTLNARFKAVLQYRYKPSAKSVIVTIIQLILVAFLPNGLIYPLFSFIRGISIIPKFSLYKKLALNPVRIGL